MSRLPRAVFLLAGLLGARAKRGFWQGHESYQGWEDLSGGDPAFWRVPPD